MVVMTGDDTAETLLRAVRERAYECITRPFSATARIKLVDRALTAPPASPPIKVLSARPECVEPLVPCQFEAAESIQGFLARLEPDLPDKVRESVGQAFRELPRLSPSGRRIPRRSSNITRNEDLLSCSEVWAIAG